MGGMHPDINKEQYPLYMTEINEKTILEQQVEYVQKMQPQQLLFCVRESEIKKFHTDSMVKQIDPFAIIIPIMAQTKGAICTALLGAKHIDTDVELILMAIDDFMDEDCLAIVNEFRVAGADAGIVSFNSIHPRYSFVKINTNGIPLEFAEKIPISKNALVSFYYFKHGRNFVECAEEVIRKDSLVDGCFYISQAMNEMILKQKAIVLHKIQNDKFHPLKTEALMAEYLSELNETRCSK
jgi:hypothetical protein